LSGGDVDEFFEARDENLAGGDGVVVEGVAFFEAFDAELAEVFAR